MHDINVSNTHAYVHTGGEREQREWGGGEL